MPNVKGRIQQLALSHGVTQSVDFCDTARYMSPYSP